MIVYNYDADLEVSDTCVRSSLLSWVAAEKRAQFTYSYHDNLFCHSVSMVLFTCVFWSMVNFVMFCFGYFIFIIDEWRRNRKVFCFRVPFTLAMLLRLGWSGCHSENFYTTLVTGHFGLENDTSHINEFDWLLKYVTGGRLEVDLEKLIDWWRLHV